MGEKDFLSRWLRRKTEARAGTAKPAEPVPLPATAAPAPAATGSVPATEGDAQAPSLPPVESLTTESDFAPFMAPDVDADLRRSALKTLFTDPRFNTMDMMDVYVDDYSKPDPIPDSWLAQLEQMSRLGDRAGRDRLEAERAEAARLAREAPLSEQAPELPAIAADPGSAGAVPPTADSTSVLSGAKDPSDARDISDPNA